MTLTAIILIIGAALLHAGWNVLSKSKHPSTAFFLVTTVVGALLLSPFLLLHQRLLPSIPSRVWMLLVGTGFFLALYYGSLAGAYRSGHMSIAYPLARSSPIIVVALATLALGRGDQISRFCMAGIVLVAAGCFLLPMKRLGDFRIRHYWNASCGLALLAAVATAGYTILDDEALRQLRNTPTVGIGTFQTTLLYASLETVSGALWLSLGTFFSPAGRANLRRELQTNRIHAIAAGAAIWSSYVLILLSLAFVTNVSYVAAFRQLSIPLGVAFGCLVLKEPAFAPKIAGVVIIFLGLVLVAMQ